MMRITSILNKLNRWPLLRFIGVLGFLASLTAACIVAKRPGTGWAMFGIGQFNVAAVWVFFRKEEE